MPVDLFLGSDIGLWALDQAQARDVNAVFTGDERIAAAAAARNIPTARDPLAADAPTPAPLGFSVHYPAILPPLALAKYERMYNLHPGYLPWGRGYYPVFWALWEQSPAGATLHEMTAGLDKGPIVAQIAVEYHEHDTGGALFQRVREAEKRLFFEYWPLFSANVRPAARAQTGSGSYHAKAEFLGLKSHCDWQRMSAPELLRLTRALSFPGYSGLEVTLGDQRFELRLDQPDQALP